MSANTTTPARPKRPLTHPGEILREDVLPALGLTVTEAALQLRVTRQTLHRILSGRSSVSPEMAVRLGRFCGNARDSGCACSWLTTSGMPSNAWLASWRRSRRTGLAARLEASQLTGSKPFTGGRRIDLGWVLEIISEFSGKISESGR